MTAIPRHTDTHIYAGWLD